jgi:tetratricopeptide (TPR) repeat protein
LKHAEHPARISVVDDLQKALAHHQQGRLREADRIYSELLTIQPNNPDALHLAGVLALQTGNPKLAVERILRAIAFARNPDFYSHLGEAYRLLGDRELAVQACRAALVINPQHAGALNNMGVALMEHGRVTEARDVIAEAIRLNPRFAAAQNNLGNAERIIGNRDAAIAAFRRAIELDPAYGEAHSNLGQLLLERMDIASALEHCRRGVELLPDLPQGHNNLGNALREAGELEKAKRSYAQASRLDPQNPMILGNIAQALQEEGSLDDALTWYSQALQADPSLARTYTNLASCLAEQERTVEARTAYEEALRHDPNWAEANTGLAGILRDEGEYEQALALCQKAITTKPELSAAYAALGQGYIELGRFEEAEQALRDALSRDPENGGVYASLAALLRRRLPDADLAQMRRLATTAVRKSRLLPLHFGLAQTLDLRGEFAEAAEYAAKGNALQRERWERQGRQYDPEQHRVFVEQIRETFTSEFFEGSSEFGVHTEVPVFILGLPRSGTTLVEQILASHSQVHAAGELAFAGQCFEALPDICGIIAAPIQCVPHLNANSVREAARRYIDRLPRPSPSKTRIIDKMPDNYLHVGFLHLLFPQARIIHCRRDLRDVALSCWLTSFRAIRWASKEEHIVERIREYLRITEHWQRVLPNRILNVQYEEVVKDPRTVVRHILEWVGLNWENACLSFHENRRPVRTASVVQVREPLYRRSVGRWRQYDPFLCNLFDKLPVSLA